MPELPEVAGLADFLRRTVVGARIADVQVGAISAIKTADPPITALAGARVEDASRRGKWLVLRLGGAPPLFLTVHLSRAGWLAWRATAPTAPVRMGRGPLALRLTFVADDGEVVGTADLTEAGTQKRLAVHVVADLDEVAAIAALGPDPLSDGFAAADLARILADQGGRHLKSALRDQSVLAGIGNAYSDEILHAARLSPAAACRTLDPAAVALLHQQIRTVLGGALERAVGVPPSQLKDGKRADLRIHGRTGDPCPVCGDVIREVAGADSSHQYCPTCQTGGKQLADRRMSRLLK